MIAEHTQTTTEAPIVLQCVDLCKCYNGVVQASDHINFTLRRGEVHAFLGENGAGKSTLIIPYDTSIRNLQNNVS